LVFSSKLYIDAYKIKSLRTKHGNILGNFETWLLIRSLKTLTCRIRIHSFNTIKLCNYFYNEINQNKNKYIIEIFHPYFKNHKSYDLAIKYFEFDNILSSKLYPAIITII